MNATKSMKASGKMIAVGLTALLLAGGIAAAQDAKAPASQPAAGAPVSAAATAANLDERFLPGGESAWTRLAGSSSAALAWPDQGDKVTLNPVLRGLRIEGVRLPHPGIPGTCVSCDAVAELVHERCLSLNPDFPRSLPRGGTGRGIIRGAVLPPAAGGESKKTQ